MSDLLPFEHGEEGTHPTCDVRMKRSGANAKCCIYHPHEKCELNMPAATIKELARKLGVQLHIVYVPNGTEPLYRCHLQCVAFPAKQGFYRPPYGWGPTTEKALAQYVDNIKGKLIVVHPYAHCESRLRREYRVPRGLVADREEKI